MSYKQSQFLKHFMTQIGLQVKTKSDFFFFLEKERQWSWSKLLSTYSPKYMWEKKSH